MNNVRRRQLTAFHAQLTGLLSELGDIRIQISDIHDAEQELYDNKTEAGQASNSGQAQLEIVECLDRTVRALEASESEVESALSEIDDTTAA